MLVSFRFVPVLLLLAILAGPLSAQEFQARVTLNRSQITNTSLDYLDELVPLVEQYLNEYKWTTHTFEQEERLRLNLQIVLTAESGGYFDATLVLSSERPIYGTLQFTPLLVVNETNWRFQLSRGRSLIHDPQQFNDIASLLDFYAYLVLALDMDSFGELAGTEYIRQAQTVVDVAQGSPQIGWQSGGTDRRNRYYLINGLNNPAYEPFRRAFYQYHRMGLDQFTRDPQTARREIIEALGKIRDAKRASTDTYVVDLFFDTKYRELTALFLEAESNVRLQAYALLIELDPGHISEYDKLQ